MFEFRMNFALFTNFPGNFAFNARFVIFHCAFVDFIIDINFKPIYFRTIGMYVCVYMQL